jgi:hypothetical protein
MAFTWPKRSMTAVLPTNSYLSLAERRVPEAASQTYPTGALLNYSSGLYAKWSSGDLAALSCQEGQNTSGAFTNVYLLFPGIELEANFLGSAAADNVLAAADHGTAFDIAEGANLLGTGEAGWYVQDSTSATKVRIIFGGEGCVHNPQAETSYVTAGDTNAIVRAIPLISALHWYD